MRARTVWTSIAVPLCFLALASVGAAQADPPNVLPTQEIFSPPDLPPGGNGFGTSVAIDGRDLIAGRGADFTAHAYERDDAGVWRYIGQIPAPEPADGFGAEVHIDAGYALIFGFVAEGPGSTGKVFVFRRTATGWTHHQTLVPPVGTFSTFGQPMALHGRWALIGGGGPDEVYAFRRRDDGTFVFRQTLRPSTVAGEGSATAIAVHRDVALIGTSRTNNSTGSVFVFNAVNGVWRERQELVASDAMELAHFGSGVALHDSIAVIGSREYNATSPELPRGQAYVFARVGGFWFEQQRLASERVDATFGQAVETVGKRRVAVTLNGFDDTATIHLFARRHGHWPLAAILVADPLADRFLALDSTRGSLVAGDAQGDPERVLVYRLGAATSE